MHLNYLNKLRSKEFTFLFFLSLLCLVYGYVIAFNGLILNNLTTILFITCSMLFLYQGIRITSDSQDSKELTIFLLTITLAINLFMILGTALSFPTENFFWVADSYDIHIPGSIKLMEFFQGKLDTLVRTSVYDRTYLAHIMGALFFQILGVNHITSALSLLIPKIVCAYFIFKGTKKLFDFDSAKIATLIYAFLPTAIFYTTTFYKEATLQMLVAMILYFMISFYEKINFKTFLILIFLFLLLGNERHYLVPCFAISVLLFVFLSKKLKLLHKIGIILTFIIGYKLFTSYYRDVNFSFILATLTDYKNKYSSYTDVTSINRTLPYPLTAIKLLLSPFVTTVKLYTYSHYATLLTWGSVIHHTLILSFIVSFYKIWKEKTKRDILLILSVPFFAFLLAFGYVAPYNGRLRDSFLPLIVIIGSYSVTLLLKKMKKIN